MQKIQIKVNAERRVLGRKSLVAAKKAGYLPAVVYGRNFKSVPIQVKIKDFEGAYAQAGESSLVYVDLDGQSLPIIIHDVARDAISDRFTHADFYKVNLDEKVTTGIPVILIGESLAVKNLGGILVKNISEIKVEALPQNLPHRIEVDISCLQDLGSEIRIKDLSFPVGVEVKDKPDSIMVLVQEPISQEELEKQLAASETTSPEEVEVIKKETEEKVTEEHLPAAGRQAEEGEAV